MTTQQQRWAVDARRHMDFGGGACTLVVRHERDEQVALYFHGARETCAVLDHHRAVATARALLAAVDGHG